MKKWNDPFPNDKPEFNMAILFLTRLDTISGVIDESISNNNMLAAYRLLKRIYYRIRYKVLKEPEKKLFNKTYGQYSKDIKDLFKKLNNNFKSSGSVQQLNQTSADDWFDEVNGLIFDLLWDMKMIMPEKEFISWEDEVKNDFR